MAVVVVEVVATIRFKVVAVAVDVVVEVITTITF